MISHLVLDKNDVLMLELFDNILTKKKKVIKIYKNNYAKTQYRKKKKNEIMK